MYTVSKYLVEFLGNNSNINIEFKDWCIYALEKKLYKAFCFTLIFFVGIFIKAPIESIIVFMSMDFIRSKISGWHLQSPLHCVALTISMCSIGGLFAVWVATIFPSLALLLLLLNICLCVVFTPVDNAHLHFTAVEMKQNEKLGIYRIGIIIAISMFIYFLFPLKSLAISLQLGLIISLMSTFIKKKEDNNEHAKTNGN